MRFMKWLNMQTLAVMMKRKQMSITQEEEENDVQWMEYSTQKAINNGSNSSGRNLALSRTHSSQENNDSPNESGNYNFSDNGLHPSPTSR